MPHSLSTTLKNGIVHLAREKISIETIMTMVYMRRVKSKYPIELYVFFFL